MAPTALPLESFTTFGDLLKHLRKRAGLTQRELGLAVTYSESYITRLENGSRLPDPAAVKALFIDALCMQREPEASHRLIQLAEWAHGHTLAARANNLPAQLTPLIGRERELADVLKLLDTTRLLTLIGAGGVGKTRLALQAVDTLADPYWDGIWLVELASVTDAALVADTAAGIFGLHTAVAALPTKDVLIEHLRDKHVLLVLDNCEHLIQACAELVSALLRACPRLRVLATSREALNVQGEIAWRVPSMAVNEAVQLFESRALTATPESALKKDDATTIAKICARLDGIPLAIELAASRLRVYSLAMIADRLDDRFKLLTGGARTALPRHQTLRALIDWSYGLLSPDEQRLLRTLSVFAGGWTLEAAESVGAGMDVVILLPQLVDKSLVVVDKRGGQRRYTMLETIRQYAAEKLNELGEVDAAHERMANYLQHLVQIRPWGGPSVEKARMRLAEMDNLRALIAWARTGENATTYLRMVVMLVVDFAWNYWDNATEVLAWLTDALARGLNAPAELRLIAFGRQLGMRHFMGHHLARWATQAEAYVALAESIVGSEPAVRTSDILLWCFLARWDCQDFDLVTSWCERGLEYARSLRWRGIAVAVYPWGLGLAQIKKGNLESAGEHFRRCIAIGLEADEGNAVFLGVSGFTWMNPLIAIRETEAVIAQLRLEQHEETLIRVLQAYTQPLIIERRYAQAGLALNECLTFWRRTGMRWASSLGSAQVLLDLGQVAWLQGDAASAGEWYAQSLDEYSLVGDRERVARLHVYIGLTHLVQGDSERAAADFKIGLDLYCELEQPAGVALALAAHARLAEAHRQMALAATLFGVASVPQELLAVSILWPASPVIYQREIAQARERFAATPWMQHWHDGERMTHEQALSAVRRA